MNIIFVPLFLFTRLFSTMSQDSLAVRNIVEDKDDSAHTVEKKVSFDEEGIEMVRMHAEKVRMHTEKVSS